MSQYTGLLGVITIFVAIYFASNNKQAISWRLVFSGLSLQIFLAIFTLQTVWGRKLFQLLGHAIEKMLGFAEVGAGFVLGPLVSQPEKMIEIFGPGNGFIFAFKLIPVLIFIASLASIAYHLGIMQRVVGLMAWVIYRLMGASGAEATSNSASIFVGQIEAQIIIKPFLASATKSELLAIMSGSLACISGAIMAVYIKMGIPANYLITASIMAVPGALVIAKILYPETEESTTKGTIKLDLEKKSVNVIDAVVIGAADGLRIGLVVMAMLIAMISLITMIDYALGKIGLYLANNVFHAYSDPVIFHVDLNNLTLSNVFGAFFRYIAIVMGVPVTDATMVGGLLGTKLIVNEFVAYSHMAPIIQAGTLEAKSIIIATFALCGFANLSSVAMMIGGIGEMIPERKHELAKLGMPAMICGTLSSYLSATLAGILFNFPDSGQSSFSAFPYLVMLVSVLVLIGFNVERIRECIKSLFYKSS